jgi:hypothetical protein
VFAEYCPAVSAPCGGHAAGYVGGGFSFAAGSLSLNSTGASWSNDATNSGVGGSAPTFSCNSGCALDVSSASPTTVASAAAGNGKGPWVTSGLSANSLSLPAPTTVRALQPNEVYSLDLVWTLTSGP